MKKKRFGLFEWSVIVFVGVVLLIVAFYGLYVLPRGELGQGEKWRVLQYNELAYREVHDASQPIIVLRSGELTFSSLGLPTKDKETPFVWILLDDTNDDFYGPIKILPTGIPYTVECTFVDKLPRTVNVTAAVLALLRKNCVPSKPA